jgi:hypothetical protein
MNWWSRVLKKLTVTDFAKKYTCWWSNSVQPTTCRWSDFKKTDGKKGVIVPYRAPFGVMDGKDRGG